MSGYIPMSIELSDVALCDGEAVVLSADITGGSGDLSYLWNGSGTDETYTFSPSSSTSVTLQVTDACSVTEQATAQVLVEDFVASFDVEMMAHNAYQFINTSGNGVHLVWEFGDDSTVVAGRPTHVYAEPGVYEVTLTATNSNGCVSTITQEVTVYPTVSCLHPEQLYTKWRWIERIFRCNWRRLSLL